MRNGGTLIEGWREESKGNGLDSYRERTPPPLQKGKQKLGMEGDSERLKKRQRDIECKREVDSEKGKKKYSVNEREGEKKREEERGPKEEKYE